MTADEAFVAAYGEGLPPAVAGAPLRPSRMRHRDMTDACPDLVRLLVGAESGSFSEPELRHLNETCGYCHGVLGRSFAEGCPPVALASQSRGGALGGALGAHAATCGCLRQAFRDVVQIGAFGSPSGLSAPCADRAETERRRWPSAASVGEALRCWRAGDPTLRLGTWLALAGVAVVVVGFQSRALSLPWSSVHLGLGAATCVVGGYLGAPRNLLAARDRGRRERAVARLHRAVLSSALLAVALLAALTGWRFRPLGSDRLAVDLARLGMGGGALLAATACLVGFAGLAVRRAPSPPEKRPHPSPGAEPTKARHPRSILARGAVGACGAACMAYTGAHIVVATAIAPNFQMRVWLVVSGALLGLAASESFHPALTYDRLVYEWFEWGMIGFRCGLGHVAGRARVVASISQGRTKDPSDCDADADKTA